MQIVHVKKTLIKNIPTIRNYLCGLQERDTEFPKLIILLAHQDICTLQEELTCEAILRAKIARNNSKSQRH